MNEIGVLLNLKRWSDLTQSERGLRANLRPDIAEMAYEISINSPLAPPFLEEVVTYAAPVAPLMVKRLFSLCNGMHIGATKFFVYGVPFEGTSDLQMSPPFDIQTPNDIERPLAFDQESLIVGGSYEDHGAVEELKRFHRATLENTIIVTDAINIKYREYSTVEEWLSAEFERAINDRDNL